MTAGWQIPPRRQPRRQLVSPEIPVSALDALRVRRCSASNSVRTFCAAGCGYSCGLLRNLLLLKVNIFRHGLCSVQGQAC
ncbi:hypothetical protein CCL11_20860 [Pseudomonas syringae]|uniref:Uncharacterized protein n=1 Tax=Pseudomonas syringae UB303 TaxID=1357287 RepID=A0AAJ4B2R3_PSESX|nr:hypothetical protein CCL11_20860 [Pseudomonas syringae]PBP68594.1 hypothetical protein CCL21_14430 [Pseudomonas syringae]PBP74073.1 hypothetical protein CCL21_01400 [Pseudomonas syringae]PPS42928.1 hypothetical protein B0F86_11385 [Pseudomonas syringae]QHF08676.1 hypothetical protein N026_14860 [Pseudomonas syringae UB303]